MNSYSGLFDGDSPSTNDEMFELPHMHHKHRLSPRSWMETDDALCKLSRSVSGFCVLTLQVSHQGGPVNFFCAVNLMSDLRDEARNHGRIRNVYFEQV